MTTPEERLAAMGLQLPAVAAPLAAYIPALRSGSLVYTSGQLPSIDGELTATGLVGRDVTLEQAVECAQLCALNALAAIASVVGDLSAVRRVVRLGGFVASAEGFYSQPQVINGASELMLAVFGESGKHARAAVGVASLPKNAPVEIEFVVEV